MGWPLYALARHTFGKLVGGNAVNPLEEFVSKFLNRKTLCAWAFCSIQLIHQGAFTKDKAIPPVRSLETNTIAQARNMGELSCIDIGIEQKRLDCRYLPVNVSSADLQRGIFNMLFGGRQPANPDDAYVRVLQNGQLQFSHVDSKYMDKIIQILPVLDILDTYVPRRKVNIVVQIIQLMEGSDDSAGFLLGAQYSGKDRSTVTAQDRFSTTSAGGLINFNFAFGNLVNTLLDVVLTNQKTRNDIKVISSVPLTLTHGYQLGQANPYSKPIYIQTTSVSSVTEQEGIRFEGQSRFHENANGKIIIKDFSINVSQNDPSKTKREGYVEGVETFKSPVTDLELEIGCSTAIRVINVSRQGKSKKSSLFFMTFSMYISFDSFSFFLNIL